MQQLYGLRGRVRRRRLFELRTRACRPTVVMRPRDGRAMTHKSGQSSHSIDSFHRIEFTSILNDAEFVMPKVESLQERDEKSLVIADTYGNSRLNPSEIVWTAAVASK